MITELRAAGFKSLDAERLPLGPLTVLAGVNGSGKSTVIQALLLARLSAISQDKNAYIPLNGPYGLSLGDAFDVLATNSERDEIALAVAHDEGVFSTLLPVPPERSLHLGPMTTEGPPGPLAARDRAFTYIGSERLGPRDFTEVSSDAPDQIGVGFRGQYTAHVLASLDRSEVPALLLHPETEAAGGVVTLRSQVELWLSTIVQPTQVEATWHEGINAASLRFKPETTGDWLRPANTGFGFSYALPIVVAGLTCPTGGTLIVENPEVHLHPAGQSAIGGFLARVASAGTQVVLETHSDHVLNGVRLAVASSALEHDKAVVLYLGVEPKVTLLSMSAQASMSAWPRGFFDQIERDLGALSRVRRTSPQ